ncbi:MAG: hypothetical protein Q7S22_00200 [Candidatus Micrarchaeota archaeon]|nr:hypothetical protein [Candidatus Micrarchaeota archaeon]
MVDWEIKLVLYMASLKCKRLFPGETIGTVIRRQHDIFVSTFRRKEEYHALSNEERERLLDAYLGVEAPEEEKTRAKNLFTFYARSYSVDASGMPKVIFDEKQTDQEEREVKLIDNAFKHFLANPNDFRNAQILWQYALFAGVASIYDPVIDNRWIINPLLGFDPAGKLWATGDFWEGRRLYRFDPDPKMLADVSTHFSSFAIIDDKYVLVGTRSDFVQAGDNPISTGLWIVNMETGERFNILPFPVIPNVYKIIPKGDKKFLIHTSLGVLRMQFNGETVSPDSVVFEQFSLPSELSAISHLDFSIHHDNTCRTIWAIHENLVGYFDGETWNFAELSSSFDSVFTAFTKAYLISKGDNESTLLEVPSGSLIGAVRTGKVEIELEHLATK